MVFWGTTILENRIPVHIVYLGLPKGAKWFVKGVNSPSLKFYWHPLEGAGIYIYMYISYNRFYHIYIYIHILHIYLMEYLTYEQIESYIIYPP